MSEDYIASVKIKIIQTESRISNGIITNDKTLKIANKDLKRWKAIIHKHESKINQKQNGN